MAWHFDPPGKLVDVGGNRLHVHVRGEGGPAVVLEAGMAATSLSWALIAPELARYTTVVTYDRAGLGWSGPARTPRTPGVIASELEEALRVVGVAGPFVLVGHSFGGLVVQRFAAMFRERTAGLVLVDALRPAEFFPLTAGKERMVRLGVRLSKRGAVLARIGVVGASLRVLLNGNQMVPKLAAVVSSGAGGSSLVGRLAGEIRKLPRDLWPVIAWHWSQAKSFEGLASHLRSIPESCREMAGARLEESLPVTAIVAGGAESGGWAAGWRVVRAERSGHWIHLDRPDLVLREVMKMLRTPDAS